MNRSHSDVHTATYGRLRCHMPTGAPQLARRLTGHFPGVTLACQEAGELLRQLVCPHCHALTLHPPPPLPSPPPAPAGIALQRMAFGCLNVGIRARAALTTMIARKCYGMAHLTKETAAEAVAFVANDVFREP